VELTKLGLLVDPGVEMVRPRHQGLRLVLEAKGMRASEFFALSVAKARESHLWQVAGNGIHSALWDREVARKQPEGIDLRAELQQLRGGTA